MSSGFPTALESLNLKLYHDEKTFLFIITTISVYAFHV